MCAVSDFSVGSHNGRHVVTIYDGRTDGHATVMKSVRFRTTVATYPATTSPSFP